MPKTMNRPSFHPDFAAPADWALMYRACGLQVVPGHLPSESQSWKRPAIAEWKTFQDELAPDSVFQRWYGPGGEHFRRTNMGLITGRASQNVIVIDLDTHTKPEAAVWWDGILAVNNFGIVPETWEQVTGGGGRQVFFRAPAGWHAPTNKTSIGVDIRGQGGFAVLPPSIHSSGKKYAWIPGYEPWTIEICDAPDWLLQEITDLVERHGGHQPGERAERTASPGSDFNAFGKRVDGREDYMTRLIWGVMVDWWRESPIKPTEIASATRRDESWPLYERNVKPRIAGPGTTAERLEREGRGPTAFAEKWARAFVQWDAKVAEEGRKARPGGEKRQQHQQQQEDPWEAPKDGPKPEHLILNPAEFVAGFSPPEYLVDGIVQRGYIYSLTARTGHGKTAVAMLLAQAVARGQPLHGREVTQGSVLFLAGENPDDIRARYLVLANHHGFDPAETPIHFIAGVVDVESSLPRIRSEAASIPYLRLVVVDTAAAYFPGDDPNNNGQNGAYARLLRQLTFLPGLPAVMVNCHPTKNAGRENLTPGGGGAFLNEVDGNLTLWASAERQTTLHWQGKFRGPEFEQMTFKIETVTCDAVKDAKGRLMPSVVALPVGELEIAAAEATTESDAIRVLIIMGRNPKVSVANIAIKAGWIGATGKPQKSKVAHILERLREAKLVEMKLDRYRITKAGLAEVGMDQNDTQNTERFG